jgi:hypothetical protein
VRPHIIKCDHKYSFLKGDFQCHFLSNDQIRGEIELDLIGPGVVHDLVEGYDTLGTMECNAQATVISLEKVEPATISGPANL